MNVIFSSNSKITIDKDGIYGTFPKCIDAANNYKQEVQSKTEGVIFYNIFYIMERKM
jgi:Leucine-rich repeat (LRR) protein